MAKRRCRAQITIQVVGGAVLELWPGLEVEMDRDLGNGQTIASACGDKLDAWFEPVDAAPAAEE